MNLRNVLRAYGLLRQLSDDESALLNILRTLNDNDREQLVASMSDKPQKKSSKKAAGGGGGRSKRGAALGEKIRDSLQQRQPTVGGFADDADMVRCTREIGDEKGLSPCGESADGNIHHLRTHPLYHAFQPPTTTGKSDAQSAAGGS